MADPTTFDPKKETVFSVKKEAVSSIKPEAAPPVAEKTAPEAKDRRAGFDAFIAAYLISNLLAYAAAVIFLNPSMWVYNPPAPTAHPPGPLDVVLLSVPVVIAYLFLRWRGWFGWWQLVLLNVGLYMTGPMFASVTNPWPVGGYMAYGAVVAFIFWAVIMFSERRSAVAPPGPVQQPSVERVAAAFMIAPLSMGILILFIGFFGVHTGSLIALCLFSYVFVIPLGLPTYLLFRRMGWTGLFQTVLAGAFLGCIVNIILMAIFGKGDTLQANLFDSGCGAMVSAVFWAIARPRRLA